MVLASNADGVVVCLEMARTDCAIGLMNQHTVGTDGLVAVVFDDVGFAGEFGENHRKERRAGDMNNIDLANQAP